MSQWSKPREVSSHYALKSGYTVSIYETFVDNIPSEPFATPLPTTPPDDTVLVNVRVECEAPLAEKDVSEIREWFSKRCFPPDMMERLEQMVSRSP